MIEKQGILIGLGPDKTLKIQFKNHVGAWYESTLPTGAAIEDKLNDALGWIGKTVKCNIDKGEIEDIEFVE